MKEALKKHIDNFIYGLLYPGFIGSMIYELIPKSEKEVDNYFTWDNAVKFVITLFYGLDYVHLYGDMNEIVQRKYRSIEYFICDIASSSIFFAAFVMVNLHRFEWGLFLLSTIPFVLLIYKKVNKYDFIYFTIFSLASTLISGAYLLNSVGVIKLGIPFINADSESFLLWFSIALFTVYLIYVFVFYIFLSKKEYIAIYPQNN